MNDSSYFRVEYQKLETNVRLDSSLRCDFKFDLDEHEQWVFSLYPTFETMSDSLFVGDDPEALDSGTAIISKPWASNDQEYLEMIKERVNVGARGYFVAGSHRIARVKIIEIVAVLNAP